MFDIKAIRENPDAFDAALKKRGVEAAAKTLLTLDERRRASIALANDLQAKRNEQSKAIGMAMRDGDRDRAEALKAEVASMKAELATAEEAEKSLDAELKDALSRLPNAVSDDVPEGADEEDNELVRTVGEPTAFDFEAKEHWAKRLA